MAAAASSPRSLSSTRCSEWRKGEVARSRSSFRALASLLTLLPFFDPNRNKGWTGSPKARKERLAPRTSSSQRRRVSFLPPTPVVSHPRASLTPLRFSLSLSSPESEGIAISQCFYCDCFRLGMTAKGGGVCSFKAEKMRRGRYIPNKECELGKSFFGCLHSLSLSPQTPHRMLTRGPRHSSSLSS